MKKLSIVPAFALFLFACGPVSRSTSRAAANTGTPVEWYAYAKDKRYDNPWELYTITNGVIRLFGDKTGYLMSRQSYGDFELTLDYRWNTGKEYQRGTGKKNSGVMYNVPDTARDMLWPAGIQFQIKEGATGDFILLEQVTMEVRGETQAPGKSVAVPRLSEQEKPAGEWNTIRIIHQQGHCMQYLNGVLVNEGTKASTQKGRLLLQYEGSPIDFRNIQMRTLQ
ncbi:3-keto-disaccharide hydrolase [Paraflavitalea pollutisoli]|uniref:3-keto-disaccharide hydrolase n=1 Tax=Paraflavitalea pollutisoli TaxID=3034143 RepID=UPI0023EAE31F|nr:DUF1080 domain-containing protein [Paraflavitalea sp. H1-2-19X]